MVELQVGMMAPVFVLVSSLGGKISLRNFLDQKVILYFYPKDSTPGCTIEAQEFNASLPLLKENNTVVLGISKDLISSHCRFSEKQSLNFDLLSDEDGAICEKYGVWQEKKNYGKIYMGIVRSTFVINEQGIIEFVQYGVQVKGHVQSIVEFIVNT